eukprot:1028213_1
MPRSSVWIQRFLAERENQFFCEVDLNFAQEKHVQTGFVEQVTYFRYALQRIFDVENTEVKKWAYRKREILKEDTKTIYGLIHARYILSMSGQYKMMEKYKAAQFGKCPRTQCKGCAVLPIGLSDQKGVDTVKVYCPKCTQIYNPTNKIYKLIDGAYFGTVFPHLFFMVLPEYKPDICPDITPNTPEMWGFKLKDGWHDHSMEMKQDQIAEYLKFQEIEKTMQTELQGVIDDVQKELDHQSKRVWDELKAELKRTNKDTKDKPVRSSQTREQIQALLRGDEDQKELENNETTKTKTSVFKAFVGLDLGTHTTKIAYSVPTDDTIHILMQTNTAVLLEANGELKGFGEHALSGYMQTKDDVSELLFFERYMRHFYSKNEVEQVTAFNGTQFSLSSLVIETFKYLTQETIHLLQQRNINVKDAKDISWVICVPSSYSHYENIKQRMFKYATDAGLAHVSCKSSTYCAALTVRDAIKDFVWSHKIKYSKYVVMDAGGCSVDFSCDEVMNTRIKNILDVSGSDRWGDAVLDDIFIDILCAMFGKECMDRFKVREPAVYLQLLCVFREAKVSYYFHHEWGSVQLPVRFVDYVKDNIRNMEEHVKAFEYNEWTQGFVLRDGCWLDIHHNIWIHELFDKVVNEMMDHLDALVSDEKMKLCQYIYVVGGFGDNHYVQKRLKEAYNDFTKYKLDIVIPKHTILSVVQGAAKVARDEGFAYVPPKQEEQEEKEIKSDDRCYHCDHVFNVKRLRCGGCKQVVYCSAACQRSNWKQHQTDCKEWRKQNE